MKSKPHPLRRKWLYITNCVNYINNRDGRTARKLKLDTEWVTFKSFCEDIEAHLGKPRANQQLVRKDMNKGWYLSNLHWQTPMKKARLQRSCRFVKYRGKTVCAKELSEIVGINYNSMLNRMRKTSNIKELIKPKGVYGKK